MSVCCQTNTDSAVSAVVWGCASLIGWYVLLCYACFAADSLRLKNSFYVIINPALWKKDYIHSLLIELWPFLFSLNVIDDLLWYFISFCVCKVCIIFTLSGPGPQVKKLIWLDLYLIRRWLDLLHLITLNLVKLTKCQCQKSIWLVFFIKNLRFIKS